MNRWEGKVAVVTGTSSGIGSAIAKLLVEAGVHVVGLSRRKDRGEELEKLLQGKVKFFPRAVDITKEDEILKTFEWIQNNLGAVHILINNAGVSANTTLVDGDTNMWKNTLDTNVLALCMMTREAVNNMRKNNVDGHIIHINSLSGHRVPQSKLLNLYPASKHAVTALTETLRQELNSLNLKIKISSVSPGLVLTEMANVEKMKVQGRDNESAFLNPEDIANAIMYILSTPPHVHDLLIRPVGQLA
ncbi:hypothetical protein FQR65_LT08651 [Abscondita terminalis]|nr:hypothetical protein FQR65_LT08651 [Abscondita terminalis]